MLTWMSKLAHARLALLAGFMLVLGAPAAQSSPQAIPVAVTVRYISSSGVCAAEQAQVGLSVTCARPSVLPAGGLLPTGWTSPQLAAIPAAAALLPQEPDVPQFVPVPVARDLFEPLPVRTTGVEIASWRLVSSDNRSYVELTVAW